MCPRQVSSSQTFRALMSKPRVKDRVIEEGYKENTRRKEQNDKRRMGVLR